MRIIKQRLLFAQRRLALSPLLLIALVLVGVALAYQPTRAIRFVIGLEEGFNNDAPFVNGFYPPEISASTRTRYRWTTLDARLEFANLPARPYVVRFEQINGNPLIIDNPTANIQLASGRRVYVFAVPERGQIRLQLHVDQPTSDPNDPRELGAALTGGSLQALGTWVLPPRLPLLAWGGALLALWLVVAALGGGTNEALPLLSVLGAGAVVATLAAPERASLAANAMMQTTLYSVGFALVAWAVFPRIVGWLVGDRTAEAQNWRDLRESPWLRWLVLAATLVLALKLGGRLIPDTMPGDIGFHRNRVWQMMRGELFNPSLHRGVPFPYPPALYALVAPLTRTGFPPEWLLQVIAAGCEALALPFIFGLGWRLNSPRAGLIAALLYGLFPASFMTVAWSFDSHIFAQFVTVVWSAALIRWWGRWHERRVWLLLTAGLILIALSHFGFYINTSLLAGLLVVVGALGYRESRKQQAASRSQESGVRSQEAASGKRQASSGGQGRTAVHGDRRRSAAPPDPRKRQWLALGLSLVAAQIAVWALYYSAFWDLLLQQGSAVATGGVEAVNNRQTLPRGELLWDTLITGFWRHYALLPLLLAPWGLRRLWHNRAGGRAGAVVVGATFAVSLALGVLPIITGTPLTTRWLMFSAWALALCAGIALDRLWEQTRWGKWLAIGCTIFVASWGIGLWLGAVVYRIRPPEPF